MITVTTTDFRANQSKYIRFAQEGKKVVLTSRRGDVMLTPVKASTNALDASIRKARTEHINGETLRFNNAAEAQKWMEEL